jgi:hypothetical protein
MRMRIPFLLATVLSGALLQATQIPVSVGSVEAPNGVPAILPILMGPGASGVNRAFIRFDVPDAPSIASLNSFTVSVRVSDDASDPLNNLQESGFFSFVRSGSGLGAGPLGSFPEPDILNEFYLKPTDETFTTFIDDPFILSIIQAEIQDNNRFAIRVDRCCGDFLLKEVSVEIDANLVPEPSTAALAIGGAVLTLAAQLMPRRRRSRSL